VDFLKAKACSTLNCLRVGHVGTSSCVMGKDALVHLREFSGKCLFRLSYASKLWSENCIFKKNIPSLTQPRTVWVLIRLRGHFKTSLNVKIQEFGKNHDDLKDATIAYLGTSGYQCICCLVVLNKNRITKWIGRRLRKAPASLFT